MTLATLIGRLEAWLQEEKGAQGRYLALVTEQERAVREADTEALEQSGRGLEAQMADEPRRERTRRKLVSAFAAELGVPESIVTVGSIVERLGPEGERLARLRGELREVATAVRSRSRRVSLLARGHQEVLGDVLRLLAPDDSGTGGVLIDAEA